ncbi:HEAT repeat domain-containing protein [Aurantiacibacter spongiae]|uniref:HEAT repeat domain-containing protein n=1 Tax=Aurantiacibacter spongiae TaxID=2488860 RepID=UPI00131530F0|nr:HEAT repeat domain-containing protein [Aurantiacibacter spongiae]
MTSLLFLWEISLVLCGIGLACLLALIVARLFSTHSADARREARREILPLLLEDGGYAGQLRGMELDVATALTMELAEMTAGSERSAMLARASALGVPGHLERQMHSRSAQTRLTAVETLALFDECGRQARAALDDDNADVRLGAALAIARRDDAPPPAVMVEKLRVGSEERSLLLVSLMSDLAERDPGAVAAILFEKDMPYDAKVAATDALSRTGSEYAPLLATMAAAASGESDLQPRIFRALGRTGHPAGRASILEGLHSDEWPVRASASEAAGRAVLVDAAERLGELLGDENWWVRFRAGEALLRLGPRGIAVLRVAGDSDVPVARLSAEAILAEGRAA